MSSSVQVSLLTLGQHVRLLVGVLHDGKAHLIPSHWISGACLPVYFVPTPASHPRASTPCRAHQADAGHAAASRGSLQAGPLQDDDRVRVGQRYRPSHRVPPPGGDHEEMGLDQAVVDNNCWSRIRCSGSPAASYTSPQEDRPSS